MQVKLDHILLGTPDLDTGSRHFTRLTGVTPIAGGAHPGFGTRNHLVSLGSDAFLELIAPDPAQSIAGMDRAEAIAALPYPTLLTFAIQTTDKDAICQEAEAAGLTVVRRTPMHRTRPDGVRLDWTVIHFSHPDYGATIPFAIDWQGSPHPSGTTPAGCTIKRFTVQHPQPAPLAAIYAGLGIDTVVQGGIRPGFVLVLDTPAGEVCFTG